MIIVLNNKRYKKLKRNERIKPETIHSLCGHGYFPLTNTTTIGQRPSDFSDEKDFYNLVGEKIAHLKYDWKVICGMENITKGDLIKKCNLDKYTFDYALPQQWVNLIVKEHNLDYHMFISTTVFVYTDFHNHGIACSCCNEIQKVLDEVQNVEDC